MHRKDLRGQFEVPSNLFKRCVRRSAEVVLTNIQRYTTSHIKAYYNRRKGERFLEIGPGHGRIEGFETLNVVGGKHVDYICDAAKGLKFADGTFDVIYASHIIEHIPWFQVQETINNWTNKLKSGGALEIWVPDGLKIAKAFVAATESGSLDFYNDDWWRFNPDREPCQWAAGRIFSYGDGTGRPHHNWHRSLYSEEYLQTIMIRSGLERIERMDRSQVRGYDHGWINLGMRGFKP